jgi:hypothetical protein
MPTLSVRCPHCQTVLKVDAAHAGQSTKCSHCGKQLLVPAPNAPPVVSAPPVVRTTPSSSLRPDIQITPAARKATIPPPEQEPVEPAAKKSIAPRISTSLVMLVFGVVVLTVTVHVLLRMTEGETGAP